MKTSRSIFAIALCVILAACSTSQVVESLQVATLAATAAIDALGTAVPAEVTNYLAAVNTAIGCTTTELQSGDPADQQALKITACFASAAAPVIPGGTPAIIAAAVAAVATAVSAFLAHYPTTAQLKAAAGQHVKWSAGDRHTLGAIQHQVALNAAKLHK
jgi:hypothetical protein